MDRVEALREWCIERAIEVIKADNNCKPKPSVSNDIIPMAETLEAYITKQVDNKGK